MYQQLDQQGQSVRAQMMAARAQAQAQAQMVRAQARAQALAVRGHANAQAMASRMQAQAAQMQAQAGQMREQMQEQAEHMRRAQQAQAEQMREMMQQHSEAMRRSQQDLRQHMQSHMQAMQAHGGHMRQAHDRAWQDMQRNVRGRSGYSMTSSQGGSSSFSSTTSVEVRNGAVYVNGEHVAQAEEGHVSVSNVNGQVLLNGRVVWPRQGGEAPSPAKSQSEALIEQALAFSVTGIKGECRPGEEPCAVCLEDVAEGAATRTLPCFHSFHRSCAEECFKTQALATSSRRRLAAVLCPVCRHPVGPETITVDDEPGPMEGIV